jgi:hypothetical protein
MTYDPHDVKRFAEQMSETPESTMAEGFARLPAAARDNYLAQIRNVARSDDLSLQKKSVIWGTERRLSAIHKAMTDAGR